MDVGKVMIVDIIMNIILWIIYCCLVRIKSFVDCLSVGNMLFGLYGSLFFMFLIFLYEILFDEEWIEEVVG